MESEKEEGIWRIIKVLEEISAKLDRLISITELAQKRELELLKDKVMGKSEVRRDIYDLCDGKRTVKEIANVLGKSIQHVSIEIAELEKTGIVGVRKIGKEKYYYKLV
jgi:DNA-binding transcriptional ArsR family regulator